MTTAITVTNLCKYYDVPEREAGLGNAIKSVFVRHTRTVNDVQIEQGGVEGGRPAAAVHQRAQVAREGELRTVPELQPGWGIPRQGCGSREHMHTCTIRAFAGDDKCAPKSYRRDVFSRLAKVRPSATGEYKPYGEFPCHQAPAHPCWRRNRTVD